MTEERVVARAWSSRPTMEGAGVRLKRVFGFHEVPDLDPFLLLDHFGSDNPSDYLAGFPWHPHRGIETITYMIEGEVEHEDSLGNKGVIGSGDVQWMSAGSGIEHQEMPRRTDGNGGTRQSRNGGGRDAHCHRFREAGTFVRFHSDRRRAGRTARIGSLTGRRRSFRESSK